MAKKSAETSTAPALPRRARLGKPTVALVRSVRPRYASPAAVLFVNDFLAGMEVSPRGVVLEHGVEDD